MAVSNQPASITYNTDGTTVAYAVPFYFRQFGDLIVTYKDSTGIVTTKVLTTDYSVSGTLDPKLNVYSSGGTVTMISPLLAGGVVRITRRTAPQQPYVWTPNDPSPAGSDEASHDNVLLIVQELYQALQIVGIGDGPPTSGTYNFLDKIMNPNATPGDFVGWINLQAGQSSGTWYGWGAISAN